MRSRIGLLALWMGVTTLLGSAQPRPPVETQVADVADQSQPPAGKPEPLSEEEQSELARRAEEPGPQVAGGALSNLHLTYIVIALAAAVIVLIAK